VPPIFAAVLQHRVRHLSAGASSGNNNCSSEKQEDIFSMELRLLTTESERSIFLSRLNKARTKHGSSFQENSQSQSSNRQRLDCSRLYGLFQNETAPANAMIAGIAMHDLQSFPQSCSEPDLSHLPVDRVVECSDHWSLSNGAGMLVWAGLAVPMRLLGVQAVLAYLAAGEGACAHAGFYELMGFVGAGPVVLHPFVEDARGQKLPVQPVILQGDAFNNAMKALSQACVEYSDDARIFHLKNFIRPLVRRASLRSAPLSPVTLASLPESRAAA
jgi:hypothetical protein